MIGATVLAQAAAGGGGSSMSGLIMIVAMIAIFYFLMIRPQNKKQKEIKRQREAMKNGDRVVTAGGIHGRIREVRGETIMLEIATGVTIRVDKTSVYPDPSEPVKNAKNDSAKNDSKKKGKKNEEPEVVEEEVVEVEETEKDK